MSFIKKAIFGDGGKRAEKKSLEAAGIASAAQGEALDYLKEVDALPREIREQALTGLSGMYGDQYAPPGLPGSELAPQGPAPGMPGTYGEVAGVRGQEELIAEARQSPLYAAIMGTQEAGEEAILRNQGRTGGFRSGATQGALTDYGSQLENRALLQSYGQTYGEELDRYGRDVGTAERAYGRDVDQYGRDVTAYDREYGRNIDEYGRELRGYGLEYGQYQDRLQGLSGLAGIQSGASQIAGLTAGIGMTEAQGLIAGAQAREQGSQSGIGNLLGLGKLGVSAYSAGLFSDIRLKQNIEHIGQRDGHNLYSWDWSEGAKELGLEGCSVGYMAHEIFLTNPEACGYRDGFITLDYDQLQKEAA